MRILILAGGEGSRLKPLTDYTPKCMVSVHGKPFIQHLLNGLKRHDIVLSLKKDDTTTNNWCKENKYLVEYVYEPSPLGTGGALLHAKPFLERNKHFAVFNGDTFMDINPANYLNAVSSDVGVFISEDKFDRKIKNSGFYIFKRSFWKRVGSIDDYKPGVSLEDLIENTPKTVIRIANSFLDIGTHESLKYAKSTNYIPK